MGSQMRRLVLCSRTYLKDDALENLDILRVSDRNNRRDNIAAILLKRGPRFLEMMEGPEDAIGQAYARILCDRHHSRVEVLSDAPILRRAIDRCGMVYVQQPELSTQLDPAEALAEVVEIMGDLRAAGRYAAAAAPAITTQDAVPGDGVETTGSTGSGPFRSPGPRISS